MIKVELTIEELEVLERVLDTYLGAIDDIEAVDMYHKVKHIIKVSYMGEQ